MAKFTLLTGGTGFIGSQLAENLLNSNENIILLKRSYSDTWRVEGIIGSKYTNNINNHHLEILDIDKIDVSDIFDNYDIEGVLHLATYYIKFHKSSDIDDMISSNITFPTDLLENATRTNTKYFINTGSFAEYYPNNITISEKTTISPFNLYSSIKVAFEDILKYYNNQYGLKTSTLKLFTPYDPKDDENKIIPYIITNYINKNKITIQSASKRIDLVL